MSEKQRWMENSLPKALAATEGEELLWCAVRYVAAAALEFDDVGTANHLRHAESANPAGPRSRASASGRS